MFSFKVVGLLCLVAAVHSVPAKEDRSARDTTYHTQEELVDSVYTDCLKKDALSCVKYKIFNFVEGISSENDAIALTDGVELVKTDESDDSEGSSRAISDDETIESLIFKKIQKFLDSHTIKVNLKGSEITDTMRSAARSFSEAIQDDEATEEGRGKKKKIKKVLGPLMAIAGLKMALFGKLALAVIAFIAAKALIIGKIALILSAAIGLRKILGQNQHVTHEVVAHPHHSSSHVVSHDSGYGGSAVGYSGDIGGGYGGHGGWQRSITAQELAYRGHQQPQDSTSS